MSMNMPKSVFLTDKQKRVLGSPIVEFDWSDIHLFLRLIVAGVLTITTFNLANCIYDVAYSYVNSFASFLLILY